MNIHWDNNFPPMSFTSDICIVDNSVSGKDNLYNDIVKWIGSNVCTCYNNAQWTKVGKNIYVRFRFESDALCFKLTFT
jgi:hypothetical protein